MNKYICVKQQDSNDCGAACLASIFEYYGLKLSVTKIREMTGTDREGTNALGMVNTAKSVGFETKGVKYTKEEFDENLPFPVIANVIVDKKRMHYIVLYGMEKGMLVVADPAKGLSKYAKEEFFEIWTGGLILLAPGVTFKKGDFTHPLFLNFLKLLTPVKSKLLFVFLTSLVYTVLGILGSFYMKYLFDNVLSDRREEQLHLISAGFLGLIALQILLFYFRSVLLAKIGLLMDRNLMMQYYRHVLKLPMRFFDTRKVGEIISRFMDASKIKDAISGAVLSLMLDTLMAVGGGIILYLQSPRLFAVSLVIVVIYGTIVVLFNKPIRDINQIQMEKNAKLTSYLVESLEGIETVKAYHGENNIFKETEKKFDSLIESLLKGTKIGAFLGSLTSGVSASGTLILLWMGATIILRGDMTPGELLSFNALLVYFLSPIKNLIDLQSSIQTAVVASRRLGEILELEQEKELEDKSDKTNISSLLGKIEIDNITFRYGTRRPAINKLSFSIDAGERIAIVGESGSGKTTLAKLLMKFYVPEDGRILLNGVDLCDIPISLVRKKVALVSQQTFLFSGSIQENLCLGDSRVTEKEMIEAAKIAQAHSFIEEMNLTYNTYIEENGSNLSGGQRQRLAIARALIKKPEILILDEATSNLDPITEGALESTMRNLDGKVTIILIAHRLSTIMRCDRIFVMDKGTVVEAGGHESLLQLGGVYYSMWKEQILVKETIA